MTEKTEITAHDMTRRQFARNVVLGAGAATALSVAGLPAFAQAKDVPVEKLMAPGALPDITVGNKDAEVTIVEYASMSCPACAAFHKNVLPELKEKYIDTGKVLLVMREFPLNQIAVAVSMLTRCAGNNDATAALTDIYFQKQDEWLVRGNAEPKLFEIAKQAGFTREKFEACLKDEKLYGQLVEQRNKASEEFGVSRTPSFFINGKAVEGSVMTLDTFSKVIDPLLNESG